MPWLMFGEAQIRLANSKLKAWAMHALNEDQVLFKEPIYHQIYIYIYIYIYRQAEIKIKIKVHHETICITKITMIVKYPTSVHSQLTLHFLASHCHASVLDNSSSSILINI